MTSRWARNLPREFTRSAIEAFHSLLKKKALGESLKEKRITLQQLHYVLDLYGYLEGFPKHEIMWGRKNQLKKVLKGTRYE